MHSISGVNLFDREPDVRVITTNGYINRSGELVMGRGCAREAKDRWPGLARDLAVQVAEHGNVPVVADTDLTAPDVIWTFPVKHRWDQEADLALIEASAMAIVKLANQLRPDHVLMPRPGCGNGRLSWAVVEPILSGILDDRFWVTTF
jgi:hypothetical protein